jgi:hypothetical protein
MIVPKTPTIANPKTKSPIGIRLKRWFSSAKVGTASGAGGVNVGKRVACAGAINAAASVGFIVGVDAGVGVGGMSINGNSIPLAPVKETYNAYTHPIDPGTPA